MSKHTVVWLDQQEARVFNIQPDAFDESTVLAPAHHVHRHPKGAAEPHEHAADAKHYFNSLAHAIEGAEQILVVGPATAKLHFIRYAHEHARSLEARIVGIETVDHPSDKQLVAYARKYFLATDRQR